MESYAQRKGAVLRSVRQVKSFLRANDTLLERTQREADRLSKRKTLITPQSLDRLIANYEDLVKSINGTDTALTSLAQIARSYL